MLAISQVDLNARLLADVTYMHAKIMEIGSTSKSVAEEVC